MTEKWQTTLCPSTSFFTVHFQNWGPGYSLTRLQVFESSTISRDTVRQLLKYVNISPDQNARKKIWWQSLPQFKCQSINKVAHPNDNFLSHQLRPHIVGLYASHPIQATYIVHIPFIMHAATRWVCYSHEYRYSSYPDAKASLNHASARHDTNFYIS